MTASRGYSPGGPLAQYQSQTVSYPAARMTPSVGVRLPCAMAGDDQPVVDGERVDDLGELRQVRVADRRD